MKKIKLERAIQILSYLNLEERYRYIKRLENGIVAMDAATHVTWLRGLKIANDHYLNIFAMKCHDEKFLENLSDNEIMLIDDLLDKRVKEIESELTGYFDPDEFNKIFSKNRNRIRDTFRSQEAIEKEVNKRIVEYLNEYRTKTLNDDNNFFNNKIK